MLEHNRKQERFHLEHLTTEHTRHEFKHQINEENKRVNVDSAKKKACLQHMDYDGFRKMVLGANLMPTKPGAINIYNPKADLTFNHTAAVGQINTRVNAAALGADGLGYNEEIVRETLALAQADKLSAPRNQEEFQKFVANKCSDAMQRYTYMRLLAPEIYATLFAREFNSDFLLLLVRTFREQVTGNEAFNNATEQDFIVTVLGHVFKSPGFDFVLDFFEASELEPIRTLVNAELALADQANPLLVNMKEVLESI